MPFIDSTGARARGTMHRRSPNTDGKDMPLCTGMGILGLPCIIRMCGVHRRQLYVCGGVANGGRQCARYSLHANQWMPMAHMHIGRYQLGMVVFNGQLYALGGALPECRQIEETKRVEVFSVDELAHTAQECYAIAGSEHSSVEVYDRDADKWTLLKDMHLPQPMFNFGIVVAGQPCTRAHKAAMSDNSGKLSDMTAQLMFLFTMLGCATFCVLAICPQALRDANW